MFNGFNGVSNIFQSGHKFNISKIRNMYELNQSVENVSDNKTCQCQWLFISALSAKKPIASMLTEKKIEKKNECFRVNQMQASRLMP